MRLKNARRLTSGRRVLVKGGPPQSYLVTDVYFTQHLNPEHTKGSYPMMRIVADDGEVLLVSYVLLETI